MVSTAFFLLTKLVGLLFRLETLLLILLLLALLGLWRGRPRRAATCIAMVVSIILAVWIWPVGNLLLRPLERAYPATPDLSDVQGIILLGGAEYRNANFSKGAPQVNSAGDRFLATLGLANAYPQATVLWSGGTVTVKPASDSAANPGQRILLDAGLNPDRLLTEGRSRNTIENANFSRALAPSELTGQWILVTSGFHMPRAVGVFCKAGWTNLVPWPVDHRVVWPAPRYFAFNLENVDVALREWVGLLGYRLTGKLGSTGGTGCLYAADAG